MVKNTEEKNAKGNYAMHKYKSARYIFRALNLIVYASVLSFVFIAIQNDIYISDIMTYIFHDYMMDSMHSMYLAVFLLANMMLILIFKLVSKKKTEALLYYICDFIIRITFSIPLAFVVIYFLIYRFCRVICDISVLQAVEFILLFAVFDYLMRLQIKYQLGVNYFKIHDTV